MDEKTNAKLAKVMASLSDEEQQELIDLIRANGNDTAEEVVTGDDVAIAAMQGLLACGKWGETPGACASTAWLVIVPQYFQARDKFFRDFQPRLQAMADAIAKQASEAHPATEATPKG